MSKKNNEYVPTFATVQPVVTELVRHVEVIRNLAKEAQSQTMHMALEQLANDAMSIKRLAIIARSGPDGVEELRKAGHDV